MHIDTIQKWNMDHSYHLSFCLLHTCTHSCILHTQLSVLSHNLYNSFWTLPFVYLINNKTSCSYEMYACTDLCMYVCMYVCMHLSCDMYSHSTTGYITVTVTASSHCVFIKCNQQKLGRPILSHGLAADDGALVAQLMASTCVVYGCWQPIQAPQGPAWMSKYVCIYMYVYVYMLWYFRW